MIVDSENLLVSLSPEELDAAARFGAGVELKFDWEHDDLLSADRPLSDAVDAAGISPTRIRSVHLPPGTTHRHGMTVAPENKGRISDFVHAQLEAVPDAYLTAHPPKTFEYREQLQLLADLPSLTNRPVSIENLPVDCQWYTIPALAYYARLGRETDQLENFWLTIDSAHLPAHAPRSGSIQSLGETWAEQLINTLRTQNLSLPVDFVATCENRLQKRVEEYVPCEFHDSDRTDRWAPFAQTVFLMADRIKSIHLNDPATDAVPQVGPHESESLLKCALECAVAHDVNVVLEPAGIDPGEAPERLRSAISNC